MRLLMISAALPPRLDGIGDHTACLAAALRDRGVQVTICTARETSADPIPGVTLRQGFSEREPSSWARFDFAAGGDAPDWILLQYNPFCYGPRGWHPMLPMAMRRRPASTRLALLVHEPFVPPEGWRFRVMGIWQRPQFVSLCRTADLLVFAITAALDRFGPWFPDTPSLHLPVGSAIPRMEVARAEARAALGIDGRTLVLGLFGTAHPSRDLGLVAAAARGLAAAGFSPLVLALGPNGAATSAALPGIPLRAEGPLSPPEISRRLAAVDLYLSPFTDGVSTRRSSFVTGLEHALAILGTDGPLTDPLLRERDGDALLLSPAGDQAAFAAAAVRLAGDAVLRSRLADGASALYSEVFAWPHIAGRLLDALSGAGNR